MVGQNLQHTYRKDGILFFTTSDRFCKYLIDALGDRHVADYSSSDASASRDHLFDRGLSSNSVRRAFSSIRAIKNLAIKEHGLNCVNGFASSFIPETEALQRVRRDYQKLDDEARWLISLISDTGMRLSEAFGLLTSDFHLDTATPFVDVNEHPWRRLKTASSQRQIPLIGFSLWAAQRIASSASGFAFPRYCNDQKCNSNSASAALNKWLKPRVPNGCVIHSFRHSLRDRLRAVECPADIIDTIGGWTTEGIGHKYGAGHDLEVKDRWMGRICKKYD